MNIWNRFWYENKILESIIIIAIIQFIQVPHMIRSPDTYLESGLISRMHPLFDFIFYGIDWIEIISIINIGMIMFAPIKKRRVSKNQLSVIKK